MTRVRIPDFEFMWTGPQGGQYVAFFDLTMDLSTPTPEVTAFHLTRVECEETGEPLRFADFVLEQIEKEFQTFVVDRKDYTKELRDFVEEFFEDSSSHRDRSVVE